ncbi:hypothetical protein E4U19_001359 [Claviceps sp. Clav32 group G5]|nr:hypothetical protein E4U19_001359 [Claviceps sp. Clav32 group G5]
MAEDLARAVGAHLEMSSSLGATNIGKPKSLRLSENGETSEMLMAGLETIH